MTDIQAIYSILLARRYQDQLFADLGEKKLQKRGLETLATCPFCGKEKHFSYNSQKPLWRCFVCGEQGDWIKYLEKRQRLSFLEALQLLATEAGVELPGYDPAKHQAYTRKADILEAAQEHFIQQLQEPAGRPVLDYLLERGYKPEEIQAMELGAYVDRPGLQQLLLKQGYTQQEIRDSGLLTTDLGEPGKYTLALLWRDAAGRATGLATRPAATDIPPGLTKYKYSAGLQKDQGLVGFSAVRGARQIVLVEGVLDAGYLHYHGFESVAVGGTDLSASQLKMLEEAGTEELLLCLDSDEAGQKATAKIIQEIRRSGSSLRLYVVADLQGAKDPDELIRSKGAPAFQTALLLADPWPAWQAQYLSSKADLKTARGLDQALALAAEVYGDIDDAIDRRRFLEALSSSTSLSAEELLSRLEAESFRDSQRRSQETLQSLLRQVGDRAKEGDLLGAELALATGLQQLRTSRGVAAPEPYLLADLQRDVQNISEGLKTGFAKLDEYIRIPQGALTIIAGRPGHGKTTMLLNLLISLARRYPGKKFYLFSYEEARSRLALKCLMLMAEEKLHPAFNLEAYIDYLRHKRNSKPAIEKAIQDLDELTSSGRLWLQDSRLSAEDLAATISHLGRTAEVGAVLVDYIQKIPLQRPSDVRYMEIKRVSELLLDQAVSQDLPIILGAQLGRASGSDSKVRLDNLRESGDIEQDANLVLGLLNSSAEKTEQQQPETSQEVPLQVSILKNRAGQAGQTISLTLDRPCLKIKDSQRAW